MILISGGGEPPPRGKGGPSLRGKFFPSSAGLGYSAGVKLPVLLALLAGAVVMAPAQTVAPGNPAAGGGGDDMELDLGQVMDAARQWATNNLDDDVVRALSQVDQEQVRDFLQNFQAYLQGDAVLDVGQLKVAAATVLPLLDAHEETKPYAAWLRERLDYFAVAEELKAATPVPPPPAPGKPSPPRPNPTYQTQKKVWVREVSARPWPKGAAALVPQLKQIFAAEGVPAPLVWVAEVESGFDRRAMSPAGAAGLFQLMPATAKQYGLSLWPWDQRRQPEPEAHAAAKYLRELHREFGDWRLALAAYNCGSGNVRRLLKRYDTKSFERIAPHLPAETQLYVPKIAATIEHREGVELAGLK